MNIFLIAIAICIGVASSATIPQNTELSSDIEGTVTFKVKNNPDDISGWQEAIDAIVDGHDSKFCYHLYMASYIFSGILTHQNPQPSTSHSFAISVCQTTCR